MAIEIDENIIGIFRVSLEAEGHQLGDYMCALMHDGERIKFAGRLRIYVDDEAFNSADKKYWKEAYMLPTMGVEECIRVTREMVKGAPGGVADYYELIREKGQSLDEYMEEFAGNDWAHMKLMSSDELEAYELTDSSQSQEVH